MLFKNRGRSDDMEHERVASPARAILEPLIIAVGGCGGGIITKYVKKHKEDDVSSFLSTGDGDAKCIYFDAANETTDKDSARMKTSQTFCQFTSFCSTEIGDELNKEYGLDAKSIGYIRKPEYLMVTFETIDKKLNKPNPMLEGMYKKIEPYFDEPSNCNCIIFIVGLGGGTGTGIINPLSRFIREKRLAFPIFVMAVLTGLGMDFEDTQVGRRNLSAMISLNNLLTAQNGIDAIFLVDNIIVNNIVKKGELSEESQKAIEGNRDFERQNGYILECFSPMLDIANLVMTQTL